MSDRNPVTAESLAPVRKVEVIRSGPDGWATSQDAAAVEEPLEVRIHEQSFAIIMRTPGDDRALAAGFLFSERIIRSVDDIGAVEHCRHPDRTEAHHVVDVFLIGESARCLPQHLDAPRRVVSNSSCGVCGRATIDELRTHLSPVTDGLRVDRRIIGQLPAALRFRQSNFDETGGLHAAGLFGRDVICRQSFEDVGRHNAVDKTIGSMLLENRSQFGDAILMVSGRVSFEIVQKAWVAGIPIVAAVSAPTSLAVDLAQAAGITLLAFVRGQTFNIYTHAHRIDR